MNKIFQFMSGLLVFIWATTANAGSIMASFTDLSGGLTINGFNFKFPGGDSDNDPSTINFLLDYYNGGTATVFQPIRRGNSYTITVDGETTFGPFFANFNLVSPGDFNSTGSARIDTLLGRLFPSTVSFNGSPLGSLSLQGNTLDLLSVTAGPRSTNDGYFLKLATQVTSGTALNALLGTLDRNLNGSLTGTFSNSNLTAAVPEPTALVLLGGGLLCMFGYSRKRA